MTYANAYPVRLAGGRLALDLLNTADWSEDGHVVHEKIEMLADIAPWLDAIGLSGTTPPATVRELHDFRHDLRAVILAKGSGDLSSLLSYAGAIDAGRAPNRQPLLTLAAASALSILADPREYGRIKMCPGVECGWLFVDETRNGRRKWCLMETCGNRAKAARHYEKITKGIADR